MIANVSVLRTNIFRICIRQVSFTMGHQRRFRWKRNGRSKDNELLHQTRQILESVVSQTTDAISVRDMQGKVILVNKAFETIYGWSREEVLTDPYCLVPDELVEETKQVFKEIKQYGKTISNYETVRKRKDGSLIHVNMSACPIRDEQGTIVGTSVIARDMTERKQAEEALRKSEAHYRLLADNTNDIITMYNKDNRRIFVSPSVEIHLGYTPQEYFNMDLRECLHPDDLASAYRMHHDLCSTKKMVQSEMRIKHKNGNWIHLEARAVPILNENREMESVLCVLRNITERRQNEELVRKAEKLAVIGELAAGIAHEIRNPLTSLRGFVQLLKPHLAENQIYADVMLTDLDRINFIVSELLVLARPQNLRVHQASLQSLLLNVITMLESDLRSHGIHCVTDFDTNLPLIPCEEKLLQHVFFNILKNSIEATCGPGEIHIRVALLDDDHVLVRVRDHGCGISEQLLPKLGEPFYTTKEKGTGLGLMISSKIVKDHRGTLKIESKLQEGTTVDVILPIHSP